MMPPDPIPDPRDTLLSVNWRRLTLDAMGAIGFVAGMWCLINHATPDPESTVGFLGGVARALGRVLA